MENINIEQGQISIITLLGLSFEFTQTVYVSCNNPSFSGTYVHPVSATPKWTTIYPPFTALSWGNFEMIKPSTMIIQVGPFNLPGKYCFLITNVAGYANTEEFVTINCI
jgi:hypothetical protein